MPMIVMHSTAITSASAMTLGMMSAHKSRPMMNAGPVSRSIRSSAFWVRVGASFTNSHANPSMMSRLIACTIIWTPVPTARESGGRETRAPGARRRDPLAADRRARLLAQRAADADHVAVHAGGGREREVAAHGGDVAGDVAAHLDVAAEAHHVALDPLVERDRDVAPEAHDVAARGAGARALVGLGGRRGLGLALGADAGGRRDGRGGRGGVPRGGVALALPGVPLVAGGALRADGPEVHGVRLGPAGARQGEQREHRQGTGEHHVGESANHWSLRWAYLGRGCPRRDGAATGRAASPEAREPARPAGPVI